MRSTQESIGTDNAFTISESMILLYLHYNSQAVPCELNSQFFLGIPRNSQKFPIMQITLANPIPSFLGILKNSQLCK